MKSIATGVILLSLFASSAQAEIKRFMQIAPGMYRGSQPETEIDYDVLQSLKIRTIINLRTGRDPIVEKERRIAKERGMNFVHIPMNAFGVPSDETVLRALNALTNPELQPVFVHCRHGKDRTGLIVGLYRVYFENWPREKAYSEMREIGFNPLLAGLTSYFWILSKDLETETHLETQFAF